MMSSQADPRPILISFGAGAFLSRVERCCILASHGSSSRTPIANMAERASKRRKVLQYPLMLDGQDCPSGQRTVRSKAEHHAVEQGKCVESTNTLDYTDFEALYHPQELVERLRSATISSHGEIVAVFTTWDSAKPLIDECFDLVQRLTRDDYANSEMKWSATKKRQEMRLPDLKYFVLTTPDRTSVVGFISYMVTYEDGHGVLYVYEIHLEPKYQGNGLGHQLMGIAELTARNVGLEKVMLTVFRCNARAIRFYERLGYSVDEYSPQPIVLRNGTTKERCYVILSKTMVLDVPSKHTTEAETHPREVFENAEVERVKRRWKRIKEMTHKLSLSPETNAVIDLEALG